MTGGAKEPSQRMLKVGEEVRHVLAGVFMRGECHAPELEGISITVSEVRMSPDLKLATAYIATLGTHDVQQLLPVLNKKYDKAIRKLVAGRVHLKFSPEIRFRADESFDEAQRIHRLLHQAASGGAQPQDPDA